MELQANNNKSNERIFYEVSQFSRFNKVMSLLNFRKEITPHYTRHTFITKAKSRKVNMNDNILKLIVGHDIGDLTEHVYTHREIEDLKEEMNKIKT